MSRPDEPCILVSIILYVLYLYISKFVFVQILKCTCIDNIGKKDIIIRGLYARIRTSICYTSIQTRYLINVQVS